MLDKIKNHEILKDFVKENCCEDDICIDFDDKIEKEDYVIIKPDEFYNSLGLGYTPKSPDCLIILKCESDGYKLVLVEIKDIDKSKRLEAQDIREKFQNCIDDFISIRFADLFLINYKKIELFFVSRLNPYKEKKNLNDNLKLELIANLKINYNGKRINIQPKLPIPNIKKCY